MMCDDDEILCDVLRSVWFGVARVYVECGVMCDGVVMVCVNVCVFEEYCGVDDV